MRNNPTTQPRPGPESNQRTPERLIRVNPQFTGAI